MIKNIIRPASNTYKPSSPFLLFPFNYDLTSFLFSPIFPMQKYFYRIFKEKIHNIKHQEQRFISFLYSYNLLYARKPIITFRNFLIHPNLIIRFDDLRHPQFWAEVSGLFLQNPLLLLQKVHHYWTLNSLLSWNFSILSFRICLIWYQYSQSIPTVFFNFF